MKTLTEQEIFDKSARHLLTQMRKARDSMGCVYISPDNLKCAVGCFFADGADTFALEGRPVRYLISLGVLREAGLWEEHLPLLSDLQEVHDKNEPHTWREHLITLARKYVLSAKVIEEPDIAHVVDELDAKGGVVASRSYDNSP